MPDTVKTLRDEQLAERVRREQELHNRGLNRTVIERLTTSLKDDSASQQRMQIMREVIRRGQGGTVIEIGTNAWQRLVDFEHAAPARLICLNISMTEVQKHSARQTNPQHAQHMLFSVMDAHHIAVPDNSADVVYGTWILHHLELERGIREIYRVLKPGGWAVFAEPLRDNPVLKLIRLATPHARTPDELPFSHTELRLFERFFEVQYHFSHLLAVPTAILSSAVLGSANNRLVQTASQFDQAVATRLPTLQTWFRIVTLVLHKPATGS